MNANTAIQFLTLMIIPLKTKEKKYVCKWNVIKPVPIRNVLILTIRNIREKRNRAANTRVGNCFGCFLGLLIPVLLLGFVGYQYYNTHKAEIDKMWEESIIDEEPVLIRSLDDFPEEYLNKLNDNTLYAAKSEKHYLVAGWEATDYKLLGDYFVTHDNGQENYFMPVIEVTFRKEETNEELHGYMCFGTSQLCGLSNGEIVQSYPSEELHKCKDYNPSINFTDNAGNLNIAYCWEDMESLYHDCIGFDEKAYHVYYTGDLYISDRDKSIAVKSDYIPT